MLGLFFKLTLAFGSLLHFCLQPQGGGRGGSGFTGRTTKIFVGGLPNDATDEALKSFFSRYGQVSFLLNFLDFSED